MKNDVDNFLNVDDSLLKVIEDEVSLMIIGTHDGCSIFNIQPMNHSRLEIKLQENQKPFFYYIGDPSIISRYILTQYMKEDYDVFLQSIFHKIKNYGKFLNIDFNSFTKINMNITLANDYQSIKDIISVCLVYRILIRTHQYYAIHTELTIVFEGESLYDFNFTQGDYATLKMVINYNDLNGFFLKFGEVYRTDIAKKLELPVSTDMNQMLILAEMSVI